MLGWIPWIPWIYPAGSTPQGGVQGCWHPMASIYLPSGGPHGRRARRPPAIGALQYPPYGMACPQGVCSHAVRYLQYLCMPSWYAERYTAPSLQAIALVEYLRYTLYGVASRAAKQAVGIL